jgi:hypothetical protein
MDAQDVGERFLAQPASRPIGPEVLADGALEIAFQRREGLLLAALQSTDL